MRTVEPPPAGSLQGSDHRAALPLIAALASWAAVLNCLLGLALYVRWSWHWPLVWDMQVIHYVSFLIDKGWAPYRQIGDMNMPGAYLTEGWALHLFGDQDPGWRHYDVLLCLTLTAATTAIARRYDWRAGLVAGLLFTLSHGAEGPINAGQRDQVIAVALLVGYAFSFEAVRQRRSWLMLPAGLAIALGASVKPTVLLAGPVLLLIIIRELLRRGISFARFIAWALLGNAIVAAGVMLFLVSHGATHAFFYDLTQVLPHYATLKPRHSLEVLSSTFARPVLLYTTGALAIVVANRLWHNAEPNAEPNSEPTWERGWGHNWEHTAILSGIAIGLLNYLVQSGATQHRYTLTAFVLLWASIQIFLACRSSGAVRVLGTATVSLAAFALVPRFLHSIHEFRSTDPYSSTLEDDLRRIGPGRLQGNIQCLDIVDGCLSALYHLKIVQTTGSTGDLLLLLPQRAPVVDRARTDFWNDIHKHPPTVFVLSNITFIEWQRTFDNLNAWPQFAAYLAQSYALVTQRAFPPDAPPTPDPVAATHYPAYRIYIRRGSLGVAP